MVQRMAAIPLASRVAITALKILQEENLSGNALVMGQLLRNELSASHSGAYQYCSRERFTECNCHRPCR